MSGDLVELVGEAPPRPLAAEPGQAVAQRLGDGLGLGLARLAGELGGEAFGLRVPDVEGHDACLHGYTICDTRTGR